MGGPASREIEFLRTDGRAAGAVLALTVLQLLMSVRFFHKYVDPWPWAAYVTFVIAGVLACVVVLGSSRLLACLTSRWMLAVALGALFALVSVAYPQADALRSLGRGSDQDDCVRTLVGNVFAGRDPFGFGYFGDPCSTGPSEFLLYFPVELSPWYFVLVPVLATLLGYWVLSQVVAHGLAVLLSLVQFCSLLFLEMSAVGSDMVLIAWLFAAAAVASRQGLHGRVRLLVVAGGAAYLLFAGSRLPLLLVAAGSLWVLVVACGVRALRVAAPVVVLTAGLYLGSYVVAPAAFTPGHLIGKSAGIVNRLTGGTIVPPLLLGAVALSVLVALSVRAAGRAFVRLHYYGANVLIAALPMAAVAFWDLSRRGMDPALWEGLHYLFLAVPMLLVATGHWLQGLSLRTVVRVEAGGQAVARSHRSR